MRRIKLFRCFLGMFYFEWIIKNALQNWSICDNRGLFTMFIGHHAFISVHGLQIFFCL